MQTVSNGPKSPLNLLYFASMYPPAIGGSQVHMHEMAKVLKAQGHSIHVNTMASRYRTDWLRMSTVGTDPQRSYNQEGIPVFQLGFDRVTKLKILPYMMSYYAFMRPAVDHISGYMADKIRPRYAAPSLVHAARVGREFLAHAGLKLAREWDVPFFINAVHHPKWNGPRHREYTRLLREADIVVALTEHERETIARLTGRREDSILVNGISPVVASHFSVDDFRRKHKIDRPYVLYLGQQFPYKGVIAVAEASKAVFEKFPDIQFVFAGPHTPASSKYFASVTDRRIVNLGTVDLETKTAALAGCELAALPSTQESFGGVFVEAWSQKRPVIGGNIPAIRELISEGKDGLISNQDSKQLAGLICDLLADPRAREQMGIAGYQKVQRKYTWARLSERLVATYRNAIAGRAVAEPNEAPEAIAV